MGGRNAKLGTRYLEKSDAIASQCASTYLAAMVLAWRAFGHAMAGRWVDASDSATASIERLERERGGVAWEKTIARMFLLMSREARGQLDELASESETWLRDARNRGDRYAQAVFMQFLAWTKMWRRDFDEARQLADQSLEGWTQSGYTVQHLYALRIHVYSDLLESQPSWSLKRLEAAWPSIRKSTLLETPMSRIEVWLLRGRVALAVGDRKGVLRAAKALGKESRRDAAAHARLLVALAGGDVGSEVGEQLRELGMGHEAFTMSSAAAALGAAG